MADRPAFYITTPIYYVNDRPHIGHCYTTLLADVAARTQRLLGREVFFLTGTDEHAEKVTQAAAQHDMTPQAWADQNATAFKQAFAFMDFSHDDFVRTTEPRHIERASSYISQLVDSGDIELGDYVGWYDPSQEEYVTETAAKEHDYKSPVTGKPLEKRTEQNYFFRLDRYEDWLREAIESDTIRVLPEARKNEVLGRIRQGLHKVPVSRRIKQGDTDWGIVMPGDADHRVYVWIEALCNYLTVIDTPDREGIWPPDLQLMAKDIVWFHAVIWPALLKALGREVPKIIYAHAYFVAEGRKMSKSLGNFIELDTIEAYADRFSLDAVRWFLATQGPLGANDADFAYAHFVETYNTDLANGIGNATSRVAKMIDKYFDGVVPGAHDGVFTVGPDGGSPLDIALAARAAVGNPVDAGHADRSFDFPALVCASLDRLAEAIAVCDLESSLDTGMALVRDVDAFISHAAPFTLAKGADEIEGGRDALGALLYASAEALRIASVFLAPAMPAKMARLWRDWNCSPLNDPGDHNSGFIAPLAELAQWGGPHGLKAGQALTKGEALFMRAKADDPPPSGSGS